MHVYVYMLTVWMYDSEADPLVLDTLWAHSLTLSILWLPVVLCLGMGLREITPFRVSLSFSVLFFQVLFRQLCC